jgi:hypothetical protein
VERPPARLPTTGVVVETAKLRISALQWPPALQVEVGGGGNPAVVAVRPAAEARRHGSAASRVGPDNRGGARRRWRGEGGGGKAAVWRTRG